jgi:hypothetical protein
VRVHQQKKKQRVKSEAVGEVRLRPRVVVGRTVETQLFISYHRLYGSMGRCVLQHCAVVAVCSTVVCRQHCCLT